MLQWEQASPAKKTLPFGLFSFLAGKPPAIEYILVMPPSRWKLPFGIGIDWNTYGHAAVRYTLPASLCDERGNIYGEDVVYDPGLVEEVGVGDSKSTIQNQSQPAYRQFVMNIAAKELPTVL